MASSPDWIEVEIVRPQGAHVATALVYAEFAPAPQLLETLNAHGVAYGVVSSISELDFYYVAHQTSCEICRTDMPNPFVIGIGKAAPMAIFATIGRPVHSAILFSPEYDPASQELIKEDLAPVTVVADLGGLVSAISLLLAPPAAAPAAAPAR